MKRRKTKTEARRGHPARLDVSDMFRPPQTNGPLAFSVGFYGHPPHWRSPLDPPLSHGTKGEQTTTTTGTRIRWGYEEGPQRPHPLPPHPHPHPHDGPSDACSGGPVVAMGCVDEWRPVRSKRGHWCDAAPRNASQGVEAKGRRGRTKHEPRPPPCRRIRGGRTLRRSPLVRCRSDDVADRETKKEATKGVGMDAGNEHTPHHRNTRTDRSSTAGVVPTPSTRHLPQTTLFPLAHYRAGWHRAIVDTNCTGGRVDHRRVDGRGLPTSSLWKTHRKRKKKQGKRKEWPPDAARNEGIARNLATNPPST